MFSLQVFSLPYPKTLPTRNQIKVLPTQNTYHPQPLNKVLFAGVCPTLPKTQPLKSSTYRCLNSLPDPTQHTTYPQPLKRSTYRCFPDLTQNITHNPWKALPTGVFPPRSYPKRHPPSHNPWKVLPTGFDFPPIQSKTLPTLPQPVKSFTYRCFPYSIQNATHPPTTPEKFYLHVFSRLYPKRHPPSHNPWKVLPTGVFPFTHPPTTRKKFYLQVFSRLYPKRHPPTHNPVKSSTYRGFPDPTLPQPREKFYLRGFPDPTLPHPREKFYLQVFSRPHPPTTREKLYLQVFSRSPTLPQPVKSCTYRCFPVHPPSHNPWKVVPTGVFPFWSTGAAAGGWM